MSIDILVTIVGNILMILFDSRSIFRNLEDFPNFLSTVLMLLRDFEHHRTVTGRLLKFVDEPLKQFIKLDNLLLKRQGSMCK